MYIQIRTFLKRYFYQRPLLWMVLELFQGLLFVADYFYYYRLRGHQRRFSIREINIEFSNKCNLRCKFCSLDHSKEARYMTSDTLKLFLDGFLIHNQMRKVEVINLHNGGETLLHPRWEEMLQVIKEAKDLARNNGYHFPKIYLLTNGMPLTEKTVEKLLAMEVLDVIGISMDGGTPDLFEKIRVRARWSVFYKQVKNLVAINELAPSPVSLYSICCIPSQFQLNTRWMHPEFVEILKLLDRYELRRLHNWAGEVETIQPREKRHKVGCGLLMRQLVVLPDGKVTVCCNDLNSKGVVGNIRRQSIPDIYQSPERMHYLAKHLRRKKGDLELCRNCETF